jgi:hypothetical protein
MFIPSTLDWKECGLQMRQTTKFPNDGRVTFTIDSAPSSAVALKIRVPYWATKGIAISVNGTPVDVTATPSTYLTIEHSWKAGDVVALDIPLVLHIDTAADDKQVQSAMYGPLVLAARLGTEDLTTAMIYGGYGPRGSDGGYPMPAIDLHPPIHQGANVETSAPPPPPADTVWFEQTEGSSQYPLQFRTKGRGLIHSLVPLNQIMDERYSVYLRNITAS